MLSTLASTYLVKFLIHRWFPLLSFLRANIYLRPLLLPQSDMKLTCPMYLLPRVLTALLGPSVLSVPVIFRVITRQLFLPENSLTS